MAFFRSIIRDRVGATAIEYAMIASLIGVAVLAGVQAVGTKQATQYNNINNKM